MNSSMRSEPVSLPRSAVVGEPADAGGASGRDSRICGNFSTAANGNQRIDARFPDASASSVRFPKARSCNRLRSLRGFSLVESLVALVLVTLALFLTLYLTTRQPRAAERLRANEAALRAMEAAIETLRGGAIPLAEGRTRLVAPAAFTPPPDLDGLQIVLDVVGPLEAENLYTVTVEARLVVANRIRVHRVETMMWKP